VPGSLYVYARFEDYDPREAHAPCAGQGYSAPWTRADSLAYRISHLVRWSPPAVRSVGIIGRHSAFWAATNKGGMTAELFVAMLQHIMRGRRKPLFLVLNTLSAHKAKRVRDYVECRNGKSELHFLSGCAPEFRTN
jgi:hypothetical protein